MNFKEFVRESGFKVLAMARLEQCEYSVVLYLLNCAVSGLDQFITTTGELSSLIGHDEKSLDSALSSLEMRNIIRRMNAGTAGTVQKQSILIGLQYDVRKWRLDFDKDVDSQDAIVFPFRRLGRANLQVFDGQRKDKANDPVTGSATWQRVFSAFSQGRSLDDDEIEKAEDAARMLVETHPVDQVLLMLRHFHNRIPTLSLLASSWQHYQELFEDETQKVDLLGARQKHIELDDRLREQARAMVDRQKELNLSSEEVTVLQIIVNHRHPRRQLFWAYQLRSRYQNLSGFFADNASCMLPVTTSGAVVKRTD